MFRIIFDDRRRREIDPTVAVLREHPEEAEGSLPEDLYTTDRFRTALKFFDTTIALYDEVRGLPKAFLENLVRLKPRLSNVTGEHSEAGFR